MAHMGCPAYVSQMRTNFMLRALATPLLGYAVARVPMTRGGVGAFMKLMGEHRLLDSGGVPEAFVDWWISLAQDTDTMKHEREAIRRGLSWKGMRPEQVNCGRNSPGHEASDALLLGRGRSVRPQGVRCRAYPGHAECDTCGRRRRASAMVRRWSRRGGPHTCVPVGGNLTARCSLA